MVSDGGLYYFFNPKRKEMIVKTQQKGLLTELLVQAEMTRMGFDVSIPLYNSSKYDMIVDDGMKLWKIQVKTAHQDGASIEFPCFVTRPNDSAVKRYDEHMIDAFATVWDNKVYIVPIQQATVKNKKIPIQDLENYSTQKFFEYQDYLDDEKYYDKKNVNYCIDCGVPICKESVRCRICSGKHRAVVKEQTDGKYPSREQLKQLIRTTPFAQIGSIYKVSDNAVRKWCQSVGLPSKVSEIKKYSEEDWEKL